jgi:hypothetical protein
MGLIILGYNWYRAEVVDQKLVPLGFSQGAKVFFRRNKPNHREELLICSDRGGYNAKIVKIDDVRTSLKSMRRKDKKLLRMTKPQEIEIGFWEFMARKINQMQSRN